MLGKCAWRLYLCGFCCCILPPIVFCAVFYVRRDLTPISVSWTRALESMEPEDVRFFTDPYAAEMLPPLFRTLLGSALLNPDKGLLHEWGVSRTKYIDDAVSRSIAEGFAQVVILGSGYDTRPYRLAPARYFEVDRPVVLDRKRERLLSLGLAGAALVPCDFEASPLAECLESGGVEGHEPTVFVWEGVTMYLAHAAINATLEVIATFPRSRLLFTYGNKLTYEDPRMAAFLKSLHYIGEPWVSGFLPSQMPSYLQHFGIELVEDLSTEEFESLLWQKRGRQLREKYVGERVILAATRGGRPGRQN